MSILFYTLYNLEVVGRITSCVDVAVDLDLRLLLLLSLPTVQLGYVYVESLLVVVALLAILDGCISKVLE